MLLGRATTRDVPHTAIHHPSPPLVRHPFSRTNSFGLAELDAQASVAARIPTAPGRSPEKAGGRGAFSGSRGANKFLEVRSLI